MPSSQLLQSKLKGSNQLIDQLKVQCFNCCLLRSSHYKTLGLKRSATNDDIRKAYLRKVKELHPDVNVNKRDTHQQFVKASEAYGILGDCKKRQMYDRQSEVSPNVFHNKYHHKTSNYNNWNEQDTHENKMNHLRKFLPLIVFTVISYACIFWWFIIYQPTARKYEGRVRHMQKLSIRDNEILRLNQKLNVTDSQERTD